jgi:hypothetical protein
VIVAAVGGAGLITGLVLNLKANSLADSIRPPNTFQRSTESSRESYQTLSWVGYGVGAACVATGAVLYIIGYSSGHSQSASAAVVPLLGPGQAGAAFAGAF